MRRSKGFRSAARIVVLKMNVTIAKIVAIRAMCILVIPNVIRNWSKIIFRFYVRNWADWLWGWKMSNRKMQIEHELFFVYQIKQGRPIWYVNAVRCLSFCFNVSMNLTLAQQYTIHQIISSYCLWGFCDQNNASILLFEIFCIVKWTQNARLIEIWILHELFKYF